MDENINGRTQPALGQFYKVLEDGRYAFWFDSHTLQTFSTCEQMFYLKNVLFAPQTLHLKGPQRACVSIGSWWSLVSELFYKQVAAKQNVDLIEMLGIAGKAWVDMDMDVMNDPSNKRLYDAYEKFAIPVAAGSLNKYFPSFGDNFVNMYASKAKYWRDAASAVDEQHEYEHYMAKARAIESQVALPLGPLLMAGQYYQTYAERDMRDWKVIAAEAPFGRHGEVVVGETDKVVVYWQGKPDLVVWEEKTGVLAPLDQKTKDYIPYNVETIWKPHNQMSGYVFSIEQIAADLGFGGINVDRCIISVCGRLQPATPKKKGDSPKPRFVRVRPTFSRDEINEWREGILCKAERLIDCIGMPERGGVQFIRNESACHLYAGCEYRPICSRPPGVRPLIIQSDYVVKDAWTPFDDED